MVSFCLMHVCVLLTTYKNVNSEFVNMAVTHLTRAILPAIGFISHSSRKKKCDMLKRKKKTCVWC